MNLTSTVDMIAKPEIIWIPYVLLALMIIGSLSLSFLMYHRRVRKKRKWVREYAESNLQAKRPKIHKTLCNSYDMTLTDLGASMANPNWLGQLNNEAFSNGSVTTDHGSNLYSRVTTPSYNDLRNTDSSSQICPTGYSVTTDESIKHGYLNEYETQLGYRKQYHDYKIDGHTILINDHPYTKASEPTSVRVPNYTHKIKAGIRNDNTDRMSRLSAEIDMATGDVVVDIQTLCESCKRFIFNEDESGLNIDDISRPVEHLPTNKYYNHMINPDKILPTQSCELMNTRNPSTEQTTSFYKTAFSSYVNREMYSRYNQERNRYKELIINPDYRFDRHQIGQLIPAGACTHSIDSGIASFNGTQAIYPKRDPKHDLDDKVPASIYNIRRIKNTIRNHLSEEHPHSDFVTSTLLKFKPIDVKGEKKGETAKVEKSGNTDNDIFWLDVHDGDDTMV
ncbi:uncharacterized protein LOC126807787 isoform X2 [Patella vulgata]|uniref:uncharacterized protein LOC126807787 isoform X2 n=1 Tax=Patella vulgata TaxID=6465 RepID=UPI00217F7857|nr:uncharacterized protein LOC126807787 isoform X2 [Patella vulgata]